METLSKWATGRNIIILLVLFILISLIAVPTVYPKFETLDILSSYTPAEAYRHIRSYGDQGRQLYLVTELTLDPIQQFISALLFCLLILYTFQRAFPAQPWIHKLALIPFAAMLADYLENASIVTMLLNYPRQLPAVAAASNVFTVTKSDLSWLDLIFVIGLIGWLVRKLREPRRRRRRQPRTSPSVH